jgi:hypothetical protein
MDLVAKSPDELLAACRPHGRRAGGTIARAASLVRDLSLAQLLEVAQSAASASTPAAERE